MYRIFIFLLLLSGFKSHAQNTYPYPSSGYIGVGTSSPVAQLNVSGTFVVTSVNLDRNGSEGDLSYLLGTPKCLIGWNRSGGRGETNFIASQGPGSSGGFSFIKYKNDGTELQLMYMHGNGNVGIGTENPNEKLSINGNIRAKEIKVETANWPDYVFEENHKILSLDSVAAFIRTHKHLPEMPAAKELEKNGIAVGDMLKLQQKKIEELTLHLIEKDKDIHLLKVLTEEQHKQIKSILNRLKKEK